MGKIKTINKPLPPSKPVDEKHIKKHVLRKGLSAYNKIIVTPFNQLDKNSKVSLVCLRIICIVTAPVGYPILGVFALIGLIFDQYQRNLKQPSSVVKPNPPPFVSKHH